ncbi:PP0621 family protein [Delftia sp. DT-2]|uniref:PP0621 family protein n=1 Tax=Delftia sp. DT-2 TaxID=3022772 RepID=UPI00233E9EA7|nr:PP0621 family protein [Delftia sp. DT-2]MDC2858024.1 PP0621 family protein [Delftia sp. DT-2]
MKYLLVLIVIVVAVGVWRSQRRAEARERRQAAAPRNPANPANAPLAAPQDMVECAHCGLHLPRSEAIEAAGRSYCSAEHRALAQRR